MKYFFLPVVSGLMLLLCGCPAHKPRATAGPPPQATAPVLANPAAPVAEKASRQAPPTPAENHTQSDQTLIHVANEAYDSGFALYQSAQYAAARADFNRAVDIFLTSGRDLKSDTVLGNAFEAMVDKINSLELDSLQQSNGFSQQDQTPVGVANGVTFPVDPKLLAKAEADLKSTQSDLPLVVNDYVAGYINYFTNTQKGHNTIENSLAREGQYRGMVEKILADAGVPKDLIYLAVAESGFRPTAVNPQSAAGGMWQFMPSGDYGLVRNSWVDERFDPQKSTLAYARYIKQLHEQFGDWYLAMAAYDWGPGNVQRAVQRTGYADFWQLYQRNVLPAETKNYVPIILAAAIMAKNPSQYGLSDIPVEPPLVTDTVTTDSEISLNLVADTVGTTAAEIQRLNPSLLRMSTPKDMSYDLHLPVGTGKLFEQRIALVPKEHRSSWRFHAVTADDTLASIAEAFHIKTQELESVNRLQPNDPLQIGEALVIPISPRPILSAHKRYRVRHGDTLITLADRFGVTTSELRRWNGLHSNMIRVGQSLYVAEPARFSRTYTHEESGSNAISHRRYRVRSGDTLITLADRFGVTTSDLRRWNGLHDDMIRAGQELNVSEPVRHSRTRTSTRKRSVRSHSTTKRARGSSHRR